MSDPVVLDGASLTPRSLAAISRGAPVILASASRRRMSVSSTWYRDHGPEVLRDKVSWLSSSPPTEQELIRSFLLRHCAGVGEPLEPAVVRAVMAARANVLATGWTGCRPVTFDVLAELLADDLIPVVPSKGSLGAAGTPQLAHIARVVCGLGGEVWRDGERVPAAEALAGRTLLRPTGKEALSLVNGATYASALAGLAVQRARRALRTAEAACAMSFEVVRADLGCLDPRAIGARRHAGPVGVAMRLRRQLEGSQLVGYDRSPDSFSLRCAPAVLGAAWDAVESVRDVVTRELNGACDNPLVLPGEGVVETGNIHGAPIALAMDHLKTAMVTAANIAERRIFRMTHGDLSGLPSFLVQGNGLNNGLMLAQYTAASIVSECKGLAFPSSVDSNPTVQHREDHVSMAAAAARAALSIVENVERVIAIELLCAAQGMDFRIRGEYVGPDGRLERTEPLRCGSGTGRTHAEVRRVVARWTDDRVLHPDLEVLHAAVRGGAFLT